MKTFKRFSAILIAVLMMISMMVIPASADSTNYTITINNTAANHTFEAYQVFMGSLSGRVLSDIEWGNGVDGTKLLAALKNSANGFGTMFTSCEDAADVALVMEGASWSNSYTDLFAKAVSTCLATTATATTTETASPYTLSVPGGYYFIKDVTNVTGNYDSITKYMIEVTDNSTISPKTELPTLAKAVALSKDGTGTYSEAVSASIGDTVCFRLTATLNSRVNDFPEFYLRFEDTLPDGLTFGEIKSVTVSGHAIDFRNNTYGFASSTSANPITFTLAEAKSAVLAKTGALVNATDTVEIIFSATVNNKILINAVDGNTNKATLHYSSDPNTTAETYDDRLAKTTEATAKVYSYALVVEKVDAASLTTLLPGAQFNLYRMDNSTKEYAQVTNGKVTGWTTTLTPNCTLTTDSDGKITVQGLAKNTYYLEETKAPETYNKNQDIIAVTLQAEFNKESGQVKNFNASLTGHGVADLKEANATTGTVTITVTNSKGSTLPETGGIGTTIFYGIGGVLVLGALALLTVRKRTTAK